MEKLKLGIIGTGSVVREIYRHLYFKSSYAGDISVEAICDVNSRSMNELGDEYAIPQNRRFTDYRDMIKNVALEAVAVNTPDTMHRDPVIFAFENGLDVLLPKPTAAKAADALEIVDKARSAGRFLGVDFHKREDPRIKEARTRFKNGDYGSFQSSVWYMLDKLMVADPNFVPRFFASEDFAKHNTPVSFLTVHMADAFMTVTELKPVRVKAAGYKQKLPSLKPVPVDGYDLVDTEIIFQNGGICHIITGWALPNTAYSTTVQSARIIGSEGMLDLALDMPGYFEILPDGIFERNPLFRNFEPDGSVSGYGMASPGKILRSIQNFRAGTLPDEIREKMYSPFESGFFTTVVCEAAHLSLDEGRVSENGVVTGAQVDLKSFLLEKIGPEKTTDYY